MSFDLSSLDASPEDRDAQQIKTLRARRDQLTERRSSYLGGIVFFVVLGVFFLYAIMSSPKITPVGQRWHSVSGIIAKTINQPVTVQEEIGGARFKMRQDFKEFVPAIMVSYKANGRQYISECTISASVDRKAVAQIPLQNWRPGQKVIVYFDANNPAHIVLKQPDQENIISEIILCLCLSVLPALLLVFAYRRDGRELQLLEQQIPSGTTEIESEQGNSEQKKSVQRKLDQEKSGQINPVQNSQKPGQNSHPLIIAALLCLLIAGLGIYRVKCTLDQYAIASAAMSWPTANGIITRADEEIDYKERYDKGSKDLIDESTYKPIITYSYTVNGSQYQSSKFSFITRLNIENYFNRKAIVEKVLRKYAKGHKVKVYYNPNKPEEAVLQPGFEEVPFPLDCAFLITLGLWVIPGFMLSYCLNMKDWDWYEAGEPYSINGRGRIMPFPVAIAVTIICISGFFLFIYIHRTIISLVPATGIIDLDRLFGP